MIQQIAKDNEAVTPVTREMEGLKEYFPQCFNQQGEFDIDKFREAIQPQVDVTREGRSYDFLGKSYARMLSSLDTTTVIRPDIEHNSKPENANSENIYISGDNLDALHHLVKSYAGQVKCVYIDPPYNTGTDGFVYNDKFKFTAEELEKKLSISPDEAEKIIAMTSGHRASHAAWLTFMMPRLQLARDLLSKDGVIFISIDDNEQAYLKQLCDNVFGEDNFKTDIAWQKRYTRSNNTVDFTTVVEHILVYSRGEAFEVNLLPRTDDADARYTNPDNDPRGPWKGASFLNPATPQQRPNLCYPITNPNTGEVTTNTTNAWRRSKDVYEQLLEDNKLYWGLDGKSKVPSVKMFLSEARGLTPINFWSEDYAGNTDDGTDEINTLFGAKVFSFPKPIKLIRRVLEHATEEDSIVLDFFGGSSTTAHAVMELNSQDGGSRKYILVQWKEDCAENSQAYKEGYRTIDEIGMERIKRAAKKIKEENPLFAGDLGFKHYTLEEVPENTLDKLETFDPNVILSTDDVLNMFGRDTVLATWLVNDGYGLGAKTEDIMLDKYHATLCGNHLYMTDSDFTESDMAALVDRYQSDPAFNPDCIVLFGYSFGHNAKDMLEKNKPTINLVKDKNIIIDVRY